jgi:tRNA dimethylallyltransferase
MTTTPPVIFLMGPTAAGKTALAMALRERLPVEIINVDAAQMYRGMDIGTAKPSQEELARAPHRLIDFLDPAESYSAARFCTDATNAITDIHAEGRIPLLVGGTMFYFRALEKGLPDLPGADESVRTRLIAEAAASGWPALHERLAILDPERAARIDPNDGQRIQRALEVIKLAGRVARPDPAVRAPWRILKISVCPLDRAVLRERIARRFQTMLDAGFVAEVEALFQRGDLDLRKPSVRAVGYRQIWEFLSGITTYAQMLEKSIIATRQLAKRQLTWLRADRSVSWFDSDTLETAENIHDLVLRTGSVPLSMS